LRDQFRAKIRSESDEKEKEEEAKAKSLIAHKDKVDCTEENEGWMRMSGGTLDAYVRKNLSPSKKD
jgi:hypothetical protein